MFENIEFTISLYLIPNDLKWSEDGSNSTHIRYILTLLVRFLYTSWCGAIVLSTPKAMREASQ